MSSTRMNSSTQPDRLSFLPDVILALIISFLPFKECVRTCVLSRRWKHVCYQTRNISFKEPEFLNQRGIRVTRISFVRYMIKWVSRFHGQVIKSFEIYLPNPVGFVAEMEFLIKFAVSNRVKNLIIDFSNPAWTTTDQVSSRVPLVELPKQAYYLTTLQSLKIYACGFAPTSLVNTEMLRSLSVGWIRLTMVESLISKAPLLESLSIRYCWGLDFTTVSGNMREFGLENCDFHEIMACSFDFPKVEIFKYSGHVLCLDIISVNNMMNKVYLDFGLEGEYDEPCESTITGGEIISSLLNDLRSAKTLMVCPYLLQVIQECRDPDYLLRAVETQHLVLRTRMHPKEFEGVRLLLNNCPNLETLTFDILPPSPFMTSLTYRGIDPGTYWLQNVTYRCFTKTLKVVVVKNFGGGCNEISLLKYLIRSGRGHGSGPAGLERVDLYLENGLEEGLMMVALAGAYMLQRTSNRVQVLVHSR